MSKHQAFFLKVMRLAVVAGVVFLLNTDSFADDNPVFHLGVCELKEGSEATVTSITSSFDI